MDSSPLARDPASALAGLPALTRFYFRGGGPDGGASIAEVDVIVAAAERWGRLAQSRDPAWNLRVVGGLAVAARLLP